MDAVTSSRPNPRGLTLIGVIISIMVFGIGMVAVMHLLVQTLRMHETHRNTVVAHTLAMEGLELVRGLRHSNWEQNYPWDLMIGDFSSNCYQRTSGLEQPTADTYYRYTLRPEQPCPWHIQAASADPWDMSTNQDYLLTLPRHPAYARYMVFQYLDQAQQPSSTPTEQLLVESYVLWYQQGQLRHVVLPTILSNWKEV